MPFTTKADDLVKRLDKRLAAFREKKAKAAIVANHEAEFRRRVLELHEAGQSVGNIALTLRASFPGVRKVLLDAGVIDPPRERPKGRATTVMDAITMYGHDEDFVPDTEGFTATDVLPGSAEKVEILRARVEKGWPLWHAGDRTSFEGLTGIAFAPRECRMPSDGRAAESTKVLTGGRKVQD